MTRRRGGPATLWGLGKDARMHLFMLYLRRLLAAIVPDAVGTLDPDG